MSEKTNVKFITKMAAWVIGILMLTGCGRMRTKLIATPKECTKDYNMFLRKIEGSQALLGCYIEEENKSNIYTFETTKPEEYKFLNTVKGKLLGTSGVKENRVILHSLNTINGRIAFINILDLLTHKLTQVNETHGENDLVLLPFWLGKDISVLYTYKEPDKLYQSTLAKIKDGKIQKLFSDIVLKTIYTFNKIDLIYANNGNSIFLIDNKKNLLKLTEQQHKQILAEGVEAIAANSQSIFFGKKDGKKIKIFTYSESGSHEYIGSVNLNEISFFHAGENYILVNGSEGEGTFWGILEPIYLIDIQKKKVLKRAKPPYGRQIVDSYGEKGIIMLNAFGYIEIAEDITK